jgi:uncharacterized protein
MSDVRGRFLWYDLNSTDLGAAKAFYTAVIGWRITSASTGNSSYPMLTPDGDPIGGILELPRETRARGVGQYWLAYIGTPDVDETVAQCLKRGGGVVLPARTMPTVGRFAVLTDPHEGCFAAYTPEQPPAADRQARFKEFSWNELYSVDPQASWKFYQELFGWEVMQDMDMGEMGNYRIYRRPGGIGLGGFCARPPGMTAQAVWQHYVHVQSIDDTIERAVSHRGRLINGPMEVPGGDRVASLLDPQGGTFALHQMKSP